MEDHLWVQVCEGKIYFCCYNHNWGMLVFSDDFRKMFKQVHYSDTGTNARTKEEQAYMFFIDILEECEQSKEMHS